MSKFKILIFADSNESALTLLNNLSSGAHTLENLSIGGQNLGTIAVKETNSIAAYAATWSMAEPCIKQGFAQQMDRIVVLIDANNADCHQHLAAALMHLNSAQLMRQCSVCLTHVSSKAQYSRRYKLKSYALNHGVPETMVRNLAANDSNAVQSYIEQLAQRTAKPNRTFMLKAAFA